MPINPEDIEKVCGNCIHFTPDSTTSALEVRQTVLIINRGKPSDLDKIPVYGKTDQLCGNAGVFTTTKCVFPGDFIPRS